MPLQNEGNQDPLPCRRYTLKLKGRLHRLHLPNDRPVPTKERRRKTIRPWGLIFSKRPKGCTHLKRHWKSQSVILLHKDGDHLLSTRNGVVITKRHRLSIPKEVEDLRSDPAIIIHNTTISPPQLPNMIGETPNQDGLMKNLVFRSPFRIYWTLDFYLQKVSYCLSRE